MRLVFIGLILSFLDVSWNLNGYILNLLPDFVGYWLIVEGLRRLAPQSGCFSKAMLPAHAMVVWSGFCFVHDLLGGPLKGGSIFETAKGLFGFGAAVLSVYILYQIARGMMEIEMQLGSGEMRTGRLLAAWQYLAVAALLSAALGPFAPGAMLPSAACIVLLLAWLAANVCYLVFYHTAWKVYEGEPV
ncbi:MAG: hypothetical protein HFH27_10620 [Clostridiaceae bacterium]|nr:hypothetical protein [Clostridiaceae bacterium]NBH76813.1 hypothetical protein [Clostridiaceae bacterium]NBI82298.1 hypothetical protein [Clostridiaceae bacterium]